MQMKSSRKRYTGWSVWEEVWRLHVPPKLLSQHLCAFTNLEAL